MTGGVQTFEGGDLRHRRPSHSEIFFLRFAFSGGGGWLWRRPAARLARKAGSFQLLVMAVPPGLASGAALVRHYFLGGHDHG